MAIVHCSLFPCAKAFCLGTVRRTSSTTASFGAAAPASAVLEREEPKAEVVTSPVCSHNEWDPLEVSALGRLTSSFQTDRQTNQK